MDITTMTDTELKALAFDEIQKRDVAAQNIDLITQELDNRRAQAAAAAATPVPVVPVATKKASKKNR